MSSFLPPPGTHPHSEPQITYSLSVQPLPNEPVGVTVLPELIELVVSVDAFTEDEKTADSPPGSEPVDATDEKTDPQPPGTDLTATSSDAHDLVSEARILTPEQRRLKMEPALADLKLIEQLELTSITEEMTRPQRKDAWAKNRVKLLEQLIYITQNPDKYTKVQHEEATNMVDIAEKMEERDTGDFARLRGKLLNQIKNQRGRRAASMGCNKLELEKESKEAEVKWSVMKQIMNPTEIDEANRGAPVSEGQTETEEKGQMDWFAQAVYVVNELNRVRCSPDYEPLNRVQAHKLFLMTEMEALTGAPLFITERQSDLRRLARLRQKNQLYEELSLRRLNYLVNADLGLLKIANVLMKLDKKKKKKKITKHAPAKKKTKDLAGPKV